MPGVFSALTKGASYVQSRAALGSFSARAKGVLQGRTYGLAAKEYGLGAVAMGAGWAARNPTNAMTVMGAMGGAAWGAVSSDTSVLGGALMGAGLGRYGGAGARGFAAGFRYGKPGVASGMVGRVGRGMHMGARNILSRGIGDVRGTGRLLGPHLGANKAVIPAAPANPAIVRSSGLNQAHLARVRAARAGQAALGIDPTGARVGAVGKAGVPKGAEARRIEAAVRAEAGIPGFR